MYTCLIIITAIALICCDMHVSFYCTNGDVTRTVTLSNSSRPVHFTTDRLVRI